MKTVLALIAVAILSGCAANRPLVINDPTYYDDWARRNPNDPPLHAQTIPSYQPVYQPVQRQVPLPWQQQYAPVPAVPQTDAVCLTRCLSSGLSWGLCQKNCAM